MNGLCLVGGRAHSDMLPHSPPAIMFNVFTDIAPERRSYCEFVRDTVRINNVCIDGRCPYHGEAQEDREWGSFFRPYVSGIDMAKEFLTTRGVSEAVMQTILHNPDFHTALRDLDTLKITEDCDSSVFGVHKLAFTERSMINFREPYMFRGFGLNENFLCGGIAHTNNASVAVPLQVFTLMHLFEAKMPYDVSLAEEGQSIYGIAPPLLDIMRRFPDEMYRALSECTEMEFANLAKKRKKDAATSMTTVGVVPKDTTNSFLVDIATLLITNIGAALNHDLGDQVREKMQKMNCNLDLPTVVMEDLNDRLLRLYDAVESAGVMRCAVLVDIFPPEPEPIYLKMSVSLIKNTHADVFLGINHYLLTAFDREESAESYDVPRYWQFILAVKSEHANETFPGLRMVKAGHYAFDSKNVIAFMMPPQITDTPLLFLKQKHSAYGVDESKEPKPSSRKEYHNCYRPVFNIKTIEDFDYYTSKPFNLAVFFDIATKVFDRSTAADFLRQLEVNLGYEGNDLDGDVLLIMDRITPLILEQFMAIKVSTHVSGPMLTGFKKLINGYSKFDVAEAVEGMDDEEQEEFMATSCCDNMKYLFHILGSVFGDTMYGACKDDEKIMFCHDVDFRKNQKSCDRANVEQENRMQSEVRAFIDGIVNRMLMHRIATRQHDQQLAAPIDTTLAHLLIEDAAEEDERSAAIIVAPELEVAVPFVAAIAPELEVAVPLVAAIVPELEFAVPFVAAIAPELEFAVPLLAGIASELEFAVPLVAAIAPELEVAVPLVALELEVAAATVAAIAPELEVVTPVVTQDLGVSGRFFPERDIASPDPRPSERSPNPVSESRRSLTPEPASSSEDSPPASREQTPEPEVTRNALADESDPFDFNEKESSANGDAIVPSGLATDDEDENDDEVDYEEEDEEGASPRGAGSDDDVSESESLNDP